MNLQPTCYRLFTSYKISFFVHTPYFSSSFSKVQQMSVTHLFLDTGHNTKQLKVTKTVDICQNCIDPSTSLCNSHHTLLKKNLSLQALQSPQQKGQVTREIQYSSQSHENKPQQPRSLDGHTHEVESQWKPFCVRKNNWASNLYHFSQFLADYKSK